MNRRRFCATSGLLAGGSALRGLPMQASPAGEGKFQLGCVTYNLLQGMDLETVIKTLETAGLAAVELRTTHKHGVEPSIGPEERAKVRERFAKSKVRLLSYGTTCEFQSPDALERKKQIELGKRFVDLAKDTGAMAVKVRPNGFPNGISHETTIQTIAAGLHELAEYGQTKGIEIWRRSTGAGRRSRRCPRRF